MGTAFTIYLASDAYVVTEEELEEPTDFMYHVAAERMIKWLEDIIANNAWDELVFESEEHPNPPVNSD